MTPTLTCKTTKYMLIALVTGLLILLAASAACSGPKGYTLYFIDATHNVSKVAVAENGHPVAAPVRLTVGGKYDAYHVSPDERYVLGMPMVRDLGGLWVWDQFIERTGNGVVGHIRNRSITDSDVPYGQWLPKIESLIYVVPQQVNSPEYIVYSLKKKRILFHEINPLGPVSADQRYAVVTEDAGCAGEGPEDFRILDLTTGVLTKVGKLLFQESAVWLGSTHRFAFVSPDGTVRGGEVSASASRPRVRTWSVTRQGGCSDLRYVPGSGIYFAQKAGDGKTSVYCTSDLRRLHKTSGLPKELPENTFSQRSGYIESRLTGIQGAWLRTASLSGDWKLVAVPVDMGQGEMPEIRVITRDGQAIPVARGKFPKWKGAPQEE